MISFDIETLGVESNAVVLSVGCVRFSMSDVERDVNLTMNQRYQNYLKDALFVKFYQNEQLEAGRTSENEAMQWWLNQAEIPRMKSFYKSGSDMPVVNGIKAINEYCKGHDAFWARGGLDQILYDALCRQFKQPLVAEYWNWLDFRTAVNLTKNTASKGYCTIPGFDRYQVVKHDPVHDAAYDILMLLYGD